MKIYEKIAEVRNPEGIMSYQNIRIVMKDILNNLSKIGCFDFEISFSECNSDEIHLTFNQTVYDGNTYRDGIFISLSENHWNRVIFDGNYSSSGLYNNLIEHIVNIGLEKNYEN